MNSVASAPGTNQAHASSDRQPEPHQQVASMYTLSSAGVLIKAGRQWSARTIRRALVYSIRSSQQDPDGLVPLVPVGALVRIHWARARCKEKSHSYACLSHPSHPLSRCSLSVFCRERPTLRAARCDHFVCHCHAHRSDHVPHLTH